MRKEHIIKAIFIVLGVFIFMFFFSSEVSAGWTACYNYSTYVSAYYDGTNYKYYDSCTTPRDYFCSGNTPVYYSSCPSWCTTGCGAPACQCTSGTCCDGCNYRSTSYSCGGPYYEYDCPWGTSCGADGGYRYRYRYCSGSSSSCSGSYGSWSSWNTYNACSGSQYCSGGSCYSQCSSGTCCDGCRYRSSSYTCDTDYEYNYGCPWGYTAGDDAGYQYRTRPRYCSGSSSSCSGSYGSWSSWSGWAVYASCSTSQYCSGGSCVAITCSNNPSGCNSILNCANGNICDCNEECSNACDFRYGSWGLCYTALKPNGSTCSAGGECQSGYCVDGYCCDWACNGTCMHCTASGCYYYNSGDDPDNECYGTGTCGGTCNGSGGCQYPSTSVTCSSLQDCDYLNYYYQSPSGDTPTGEDWCWYRDYADTYQYCNGSGSCSALNCSSYEAVSKYGCGTCKYIPSNYCTGSTQGSCANYSLGTSCGSNQECNGSGTCLDCAYPSGTISASKTTVQPGEQFTITITGYDNYDVWQISSNEGSNSWNSGSAQTCLFNQTSCGKSWDYTKTTPGTYTFYGRVRDSDDVQGCSGYHETGIGSVTVTVSKKANGESCSVAGECQSGYCVDGVCCSGSCSGTCVTCYFSATYKGDCYYITAGEDPANECYGTGTCGGTCNGSGGCQYPSTSVTCSSLQDCDYLNYYYQSGTESPTATENCYYRDYADTYQYCNGSGSCSTLNCSAYSNPLQYSCGTCKYISSSNCTGATLGSCSNYSLGTSCGTNQECNGSGSCSTCYFPTGSISASKTTLQIGETFTLSVAGNDDHDVYYLTYNKGSNTWNEGNKQQCVGSQTSCTKTWDISESTAGTYTYYAWVQDSDGRTRLFWGSSSRHRFGNRNG